MSASEVSVATEALAMISRGGIQSFDDPSPEAASAKLHFPSAKRAVLGAFDWTQARVVRELIRADQDPRGYAYAYAVPGDYIEIWRIGPKRIVMDPNVPATPYEFGYNDSLTDDQVFIFTDAVTAWARYSSSRVPVGRLPQYLTDLIAVNLASRLAMPLRRDGKLMQVLEQKYIRDLSAGKTIAANSEPEIIAPDFVPDTIRVRRT